MAERLRRLGNFGCVRSIKAVLPRASALHVSGWEISPTTGCVPTCCSLFAPSSERTRALTCHPACTASTTTSCPIKPVPPRINRVLFMIVPLSHSCFVPDSPLFYHHSLSDHYPAIQCGDKSSICYSKRRFVTNTGSRATIYTAEKIIAPACKTVFRRL